MFVWITEWSLLSEVWDNKVQNYNWDTFNNRKTSPSSLHYFFWTTKQSILCSAFREVLNISIHERVIAFNSNVSNQFLNSWPDFLFSLCRADSCGLLNTGSCDNTVLLDWKRHALLLMGPPTPIINTNLQLTTQSIVNQNCLSEMK